MMFLSLVSIASSAGASPDFGPNVIVVDPSTPDLQARLDAVFAEQERSEFGPGRYALLFRPGDYHADVQVGFYTQVLGLGRSPDDVHISGAVRVTADWRENRNATLNFWRGAENLAVTPTRENGTNVWGVSQATALRRVHVRGNLDLWAGGWASGGFMADCRIDGQVNSGTQQQWLSRNVEWQNWIGSSWNMVFVGVTRPPSGTWPTPPYTVVERTPVSREKPFLRVTERGGYEVFVPAANPREFRGITWADAPTPGRAVPLDEFHVARAERDTAATLNAALAAGRHLLFTPGIYRLDAPVKIERAGTIVLGIGYATLLATHGNSLLEVADVNGVSLAGLLLEAGETASRVLLEIGPAGSDRSHAADPIYLHDVYCRAGSSIAGRVHTFVIVNSHDVVIDHTWLWRADHGPGAGWEKNVNARGLVVNGRDVTVYGLFVEHTQEYQTLWNGEGGRVFLYQCELPYDPPSQAAWMNGPRRGYAAYKVADHVQTHEAWGLGVYAVLRNTPVILDNAIECPVAPGVKFHHMMTARLNRQPGSGIAAVINGEGGEVVTELRSWFDEYPRH
ncbi:MAG: coagulation factor 5/8 type domain-containing protein [Opitutus sp.]|nr:coagulation factor 5/8 type domain-containing protein [Opitutus sp.]